MPSVGGGNLKKTRLFHDVGRAPQEEPRLPRGIEHRSVLTNLNFRYRLSEREKRKKKSGGQQTGNGKVGSERARPLKVKEEPEIIFQIEG